MLPHARLSLSSPGGQLGGWLHWRKRDCWPPAQVTLQEPQEVQGSQTEVSQSPGVQGRFWISGAYSSPHTRIRFWVPPAPQVTEQSLHCVHSWHSFVPGPGGRGVLGGGGVSGGGVCGPGCWVQGARAQRSCWNSSPGQLPPMGQERARVRTPSPQDALQELQEDHGSQPSGGPRVSGGCPGHARSKHSSVMKGSPGQSPGMGHSRCRSRDPRPQVTEQLDQGLHWPQFTVAMPQGRSLHSSRWMSEPGHMVPGGQMRNRVRMPASQVAEHSDQLFQDSQPPREMGQARSRQEPDWEAEPGQKPPGGQLRLRTRPPSPHVAEHPPHSPHELQPSTPGGFVTLHTDVG